MKGRKQVVVKFDTWQKAVHLKEVRAAQLGRPVTFSEIIGDGLDLIDEEHWVDSEDREAIRDAGPFEVQSRNDGTLTVYAHWDGLDDGLPGWRRPAEATPDQETGGPGVFTRLGAAASVQQVLNRVASDR